MRVVLYAEGAGETRGHGGLGPAPTMPIPEDSLGAGHVLVGRLVSQVASVPEAAIRFEQPLNTGPRRARGSDFLHRRTLRQLLSWARPETKPELAVVLIDAARLKP